jgi:hypothetical protein
MEQKRILVDGEPMVIEPEATIELNEANPLTSNEPMRTVLASRDYDIIADLADDCKPLAENEGRTGYFHVCKEGEEQLEEVNELEVFEYEGAFDPIPLPC